MKPFLLKVEKPWGYELIFTQANSLVTGKILHLNAGTRFSLQYHDRKEETLVLLNGKALLILQDSEKNQEEISMEPQKGYLLKPLQIHRVKALTDCDILEVSTIEVGNTIRLEDDYARGTETEEDRKNR